MKLTNEQLKRIIKEEIENIIHEGDDVSGASFYSPSDKKWLAGGNADLKTVKKELYRQFRTQESDFAVSVGEGEYLVYLRKWMNDNGVKKKTSDGENMYTLLSKALQAKYGGKVEIR